MSQPLSLNALKMMRLLQKGSYADCARVKTASALEMEMERHLRQYLFYLLERDVRSARFLDTLRRSGAAFKAAGGQG
jgi:hypothetical protein